MAITRSNNPPADDNSPNDLEKLEVNLKTMLESFNEKLETNYVQQGLAIADNTKSIAELNDMMLGISVQFTKLMTEKEKTSPPNSLMHLENSGGSQNHERNMNRPHHPYSTRLTRIEFPKFDGTDLKSWLYRCNQFFEFDGVMEEGKVRLAAIHMEGKALLWHQNYVKAKLNVMPTWEQYVHDITQRFGELFDDPMAELKALQQTAGIQEYHDEFDAIASRLNLTEQHLLSCYLGGLEKDIAMAVRMFAPKSLQETFCLAKLQEAAYKAKQNKPPHKPPLLPTPTFTKSLTTFTPNPKPQPAHPTHKNTTLSPQTPKPFTPQNSSRRTLSTAEFNEKRAKGLCFWCDDKFEAGHKCRGKRPQLYHLEMEESEDINEDTESDNLDATVESQFAHISVQALDGSSAFQTMRVVGHHGKKMIHILIDSGSTHNFIDFNRALRLDCRVEKTTPMWVRVADGGQLKCDSLIKGFTWKMQGVIFSADVFLLPLSGSDMVLGIQWLAALGPIVWDFQQLSMEFKHLGNKIKLRGATKRKLKGMGDLNDAAHSST